MSLYSLTLLFSSFGREAGRVAVLGVLTAIVSFLMNVIAVVVEQSSFHEAVLAPRLLRSTGDSCRRASCDVVRPAARSFLVAGDRRRIRTVSDARSSVRVVYGSANTNTFAALPGFNSGARRNAVVETSEVPVVTATYCLPPTAYVIGKAEDR